MGAAIGQWALQQAGNAVEAGMGLLLGKHNDKRQLKQQQALQAMQVAGNKEMMDYSMMKELQMWKDTNYKAQMEQLEMAGLNPALLYGMKGGGGVTTGSPQGSVEGAKAPSGGGEVQAMLGMGIQRELQQAQKENIEAQTENTKADTANKTGVEPALKEAQIADLTQGVENKKAQEELTKVQTRLNGIEEQLKGRSLEDSIRFIEWQSAKAMEEMDQAKFTTQIAEATWQDKVQQVKADLMGKWLQNTMTQTQTRSIEKGMQKTDAEIKETITGIIQKWKALEIQGMQAQTADNRQRQDAWINDVQKSTGIPMDILKEALDGILRKGTTITNNKQWNNEFNRY